MDLDQARDAHAQWKQKLRDAIASKGTLDATTIARNDACAFGQWLHGDALGRYGPLTCHAQCMREHARFHKEAAVVASAINAQRYDEATRMLDEVDTPFNAASRAIGGALSGLKHEAGL